MLKETVLILESNLSGYGYSAIKFSKTLGYHTLFMCRDPREYRTSVTNPLEVADEIAIVDTFDIGKILDFISNFNGKIIRCLAFDDFRVLQSSIVNQYLIDQSAAPEPSHPSLAALLACRFKSVLRKKLIGSKYELRHAVFNENNCDLATETPFFGFPCVVKPVDENGSLAVRVCHDVETLRDAIDCIRALPASNSRGYSSSRKFIIEEYIGGQEYSAEIVWDPKKYEWTLLGVTKKFVTTPPHCVELAHIFPFQLENDIQEKVICGLRNIMDIIGLKNTFCHVEFKIYNSEFYIIEINPRPGGDMIAELMELAKGFNPIEMMVLSNLGVDLGSLPIPSKNEFAGIAFVTEESIGEINGYNILDTEIFREKSFSLPRKGNGLKNSDDRLGYAIYTNPSLFFIEEKIDTFLKREAFIVDIKN